MIYAEKIRVCRTGRSGLEEFKTYVEIYFLLIYGVNYNADDNLCNIICTPIIDNNRVTDSFELRKFFITCNISNYFKN